ncbi:maltose operon protein MalM [Photorhabdus luminescens]|uniref:Maltose operon protein MalM n=1 Tax=Photorhabdus luminescens subsp. sonorensis TaxID=1173677 RepID=A0A5C4RE17_PHOLU|nr:maltose operon protein MalM [Photorhabdus luminescens]TNH42135.1 maltose operon protein MalM [Photorhabdus luminescens subsp. sonorensis]
MKTKLLSCCLSAVLCSAAPLISYATSITTTIQATTTPDIIAPSLSTTALQKLSWQPINTSDTQTIILNATSQHLNEGDIQGPIAAFALPANRGSLDITLSSLVQDKQVYVPNVLVLDQGLRPAAFYPSSYFPYERPGVMSTDRLEGTLKLTPALGQQQIYILVYTTHTDLQQSTQMVDPAKAYAQGVGNAVPAIPDPVARHTQTGTLKLKVKSEQNAGNITIGQVFSTPAQEPIIIGPTQATVTSSTPQKVKPVLSDTEHYFSDAIKKEIKNGNIDKALKLLDEAERLGSSTARETFINSIKNKG